MGNETKTSVTTMGSAIAIILVIVLGQVGVVLDPAVSAGGTAALALIFNYFIPAKKVD